MKTCLALVVLGFVAVLFGPGRTALAGDGHDHNGGAPEVTGAALPRFTAVSEAFELVGVLEGKRVTLFLDRFVSNVPVKGAQIELEIAGETFKAQSGRDDSYELTLNAVPKPGVTAVTAMVTAGDEVDLLVGEIDLHETGHAHDAVHRRSLTVQTGWAIGGVAAATLLLFGGRRLVSARRVRAGVAR